MLLHLSLSPESTAVIESTTARLILSVRFLNGLPGGVRTAADLAPTDLRALNPRFSPEALEKNARLVSALEAVARAKGCTAGQLALAWVANKGEQLGLRGCGACGPAKSGPAWAAHGTERRFCVLCLYRVFHPHRCVPIPGTTNPARLAQNVAAASITLTPEVRGAVDWRLAPALPWCTVARRRSRRPLSGTTRRHLVPVVD